MNRRAIPDALASMASFIAMIAGLVVFVPVMLVVGILASAVVWLGRKA